jgi:peptide-methionine (S)-S-oxide reductase
MSEKTEIATLAGGCFWCTEAIFKRLKGVISVLPGYAGGHIKNPSYDQVCSGTSGHAESLQIEFDPTQISFEKILDVFWHTHNPTTLNRQGNDVGSQYRSAIFYHSKKQEELAQKSKAQIEKEGVYTDPIVTEIIPFTNFYIAENYHKDYFDKNQEAPYCSTIISPKIKKLLEIYSKDIKDEYKQ